jgi:hypothetical protein
MSSTTPAALRCAVPDDYQGVALTAADWSAAAVEVTVFREHLTGDALVAAVRECEVLVVMRERTPLTRAVLARLPRPRLVVTSGMRNARPTSTPRPSGASSSAGRPAPRCRRPS